MCIAAIAREGGFSQEELEQFFRANMDGGGFSYVEDNKVVNINHITDLREYMLMGKSLQNETNLVTHCRIATMGAIDESNSHPFMLDGSASLVHNGSLFYDSNNNYRTGPSDTKIFADKFAKYLSKKELMTEDMIAKLGTIIGKSNKLILLYPTNEFLLVNEDSGSWSNDKTKWYSNKWWERQPVTSHMSKYKPYQASIDDDEDNFLGY